MEATIRFGICHEQKRISVLAVSCHARTFWENFHPGAPVGYDSGMFFHRCLQQLQRELDGIDILQKVVRRIFGYEWNVDVDGTNMSRAQHVTIYESEVVYERTLFMKYMSPGISGRVVAYYDLHEEHDAATIIQSHLRGWRMRRQYRFNPHTQLGRYLALKLGEFL